MIGTLSDKVNQKVDAFDLYSTRNNLKTHDILIGQWGQHRPWKIPVNAQKMKGNYPI